MASFNKIILVGNMVADPELKQTQNGVAVTSFRIAVQRRFAQGQTDFFDIVAWRQTAEFVTKFFTKGRAILVCGSLQTRSWTDNNGNKRIAYEVVADECNFVDSKAESAPTKPLTQTDVLGNDTQYEELSNDDELPF